jgi:hypothetical protein
MQRREAVLKHQNGQISANLLWGPPLPADYAVRVADACAELRRLGYFASPFPEGDGITMSHPTYSPEAAHGDVCSQFPWLDITDGLMGEGELYGDSTVECTILVPVEKLHLTCLIEASPYVLIPALGHEEDGSTHAWHEYLSAGDIDGIYGAFEVARKNGNLGITREDFLLAYPLVQTTIAIPYRELFAAQTYVDGMIPLLCRCAEYADRGLDLVRLKHCNYRRLEQLCGIAGQLLDGFHAAYVIPKQGPIKPRLYCHLATPYGVTPNWLGLEVAHDLDSGTAALAALAHSSVGHEMALRVRGALRAAGQAFYILTPEARFLNLVFALDGLCSPKKPWSGLAHHSYIAAVGANGSAEQFDRWLRMFDAAYANIRNPIVHGGTSFIELGADPAEASDRTMYLLHSCVEAIVRRSVTTIGDLQQTVIAELKTPRFQEVLATYVGEKNSSRPSENLMKMPKWT